MNLYLSLGHIWTGTQADAKAAQNGKDFESIEVPTDKPGLIAWLNARWAERTATAEPLPAAIPGFDVETDGDTMVASLSPAAEALFMGSRDPAAKTICLTCGRTPRQQAVAVNCEASMSIQAALHDVTDPRSLDRIIELAEQRQACLSGMHSWVKETGKLPADTVCDHCPETYGDPS